MFKNDMIDSVHRGAHREGDSPTMLANTEDFEIFLHLNCMAFSLNFYKNLPFLCDSNT